MNKALHVFVYLFLILAGTALWFELQLNDKRQLLTDRNRLQEEFLIKIARTIEKGEPTDVEPIELKKDVSPVEAKKIDSPDTENVLDGYANMRENANLETLNWNNDAIRRQLRQVYVTDPVTGEVVKDMDKPVMTGKGTEQELLENLLTSCVKQLERLNKTRAELVALRGKLETQVNEINKLKPEMRQDKVTIVELKAKIAKLEGEKAQLEDQITKLKAQIEELNAEVTSLKDEVVRAKEETETMKEELNKQKKLVESLKKIIRDLNNRPTAGGNAQVTRLPAGDKGKVIEANNNLMFAIVELSPEAMKQLKGSDMARPIPPMELAIKRANGKADEFVGKIRFRQEVAGKNYVICDILGAWKQSDIKPGDVIFAD